MIDANGEPTRWHCAFLIADGKVRWGVPGQVVRISYDEIWVGSHTTPNAGEETTGELEILGGETYFPSHLVIGRNNGNPTTIGGDGIARPTVTVRDGYVNPEKVIMCYDNFDNTTSKTYATLNVLGGVFEVNDEFRMGNHKGGGSKATINVMNGGQFLHRNVKGYNFRMGQGGVENELNVSGAGTLFEVKGNVETGHSGSTSTVNLSTGATTRCAGMTKKTGTSYLNWDGGTIQLTGNEPTIDAFTQIRLGANPCVLDATLLDGGSLNVNAQSRRSPFACRTARCFAWADTTPPTVSRTSPSARAQTTSRATSSTATAGSTTSASATPSRSTARWSSTPTRAARTSIPWSARTS